MSKPELASFFPVLRAASVGDRQNLDIRRNNFVNNREGKSFQKEAANTRFIRQSFQSGKLERVVPNSLQSGIHSSQELQAEADAPLFVSLGRLPRFLFGRWIDAKLHDLVLETSD